MKTLGLLNGLGDLGVRFEVANGRVVQMGGPAWTGAVAQKVTAHEQELVALHASPCAGLVYTEAIFGPTDLPRVALLVSAGPYVAVGEVGGNLALTTDGMRVAVVAADRVAALMPDLSALLAGAHAISWGSTPIPALDLQLPSRLLETTGDLAAGDTLSEVVASVLLDSTRLDPKADDMARLTYTTRAVGMVGEALLDHIEACGMGPVLQLERDVAVVLEGASERGVRFDLAAWKALVDQREGDLAHHATIARKHLGVGLADQDALHEALRARGIPVESAKGDELERLLATFLRDYRQHYAMTHRGLCTGLRPSTLRALRRAGPQCDVDWKENRIRVRRSHTVGEEVMKTTKQRRRYTIVLPTEEMDILRWHVDTQLHTPEQKASELLFPSLDGGFRSTSVLKKPFQEVAREPGSRSTSRREHCGARSTTSPERRASRTW